MTILDERSSFEHMSDEELNAEVRKMVDEINAADKANVENSAKARPRDGVKR